MDDWMELLDEYEKVIKETPAEFFNITDTNVPLPLLKYLIRSARALERVREWAKRRNLWHMDDDGNITTTGNELRAILETEKPQRGEGR